MNPANRMFSIAVADMTAAIATMWMACTVGITHAAEAIAMLLSVCAIVSLNLCITDIVHPPRRAPLKRAG
jgi:hypothetical protein